MMPPLASAFPSSLTGVIGVFLPFFCGRCELLDLRHAGEGISAVASCLRYQGERDNLAPVNDTFEKIER
jgi:endogenous inhibitor of DNA gyrase (YacG/DUF329 family)